MSGDKAAMRKAIRSVMRHIPGSALTSASELACARAAALCDSATAVSVFLPMPVGEVDTGPLLSTLFAAGKRVFVPRVEGDSRHDMRMLHVADPSALASFPRSKWGIPEPTDEQASAMEDGLAAAVIDLVIVPGVAFDTQCLRLGQGKGFYDTWLAKLADARSERGLPPARTVGLGLAEQLVDRVPVDVHDLPLDYVCLPSQTLSRPDAPPTSG